MFVISNLEFRLFQSLGQKIKILKFETKYDRILYFGAGIEKSYSHICPCTRICLLVKLGAKKTKIGTNSILFGLAKAGI